MACGIDRFSTEDSGETLLKFYQDKMKNPGIMLSVEGCDIKKFEDSLKSVKGMLGKYAAGVTTKKADGVMVAIEDNLEPVEWCTVYPNQKAAIGAIGEARDKFCGPNARNVPDAVPIMTKKGIKFSTLSFITYGDDMGEMPKMYVACGNEARDFISNQKSSMSLGDIKNGLAAKFKTLAEIVVSTPDPRLVEMVDEMTESCSDYKLTLVPKGLPKPKKPNPCGGDDEEGVSCALPRRRKSTRTAGSSKRKSSRRSKSNSSRGSKRR